MKKEGKRRLKQITCNDLEFFFISLRPSSDVVLLYAENLIAIMSDHSMGKHDSDTDARQEYHKIQDLLRTCNDLMS